MNDTPAEGLEFLRTLTVLYVEDDEEVRAQRARFLARRVKRLDVAENGRAGLDLFLANSYDVVVTDIKMPEMDGLDMAERIKARHREMPIIIITAYSDRDYLIRAIDLGIDRYVTKPIDPDALVNAIYRSTLARSQAQELIKAQQQVLDTLEQTVTVLARAIELRDPYTNGHQKRVANLAVAIAGELGLPADTIAGLRLGGLVHDVGKIQVPSEILTKPGNLTAIESEMVRAHVRAGFELLKEVTFPWPIADMVLQHHERLDGSGYPFGLKDGDILIEAKIIAVADVVEAISSHRPYRPSLGVDVAVQEIRKGSGLIYDPAVVDACIRVLERHPEMLAPAE